MRGENHAESEAEPGDFPYPLTKGPNESRYLTWLRNHSNYMATRGFLDYLRMGGVLVRGILLNFLILLFLLLLASLAISHLYGPQLRTLPSSIDLPLANLETLANKLKGPKTEVQLWVTDRLSDKTKEALNAVDGQQRDLQVAILDDLRDLIDSESIVAQMERESIVAALKREPIDSKSLVAQTKRESIVAELKHEPADLVLKKRVKQALEKEKTRVKDELNERRKAAKEWRDQLNQSNAGNDWRNQLSQILAELWAKLIPRGDAQKNTDLAQEPKDSWWVRWMTDLAYNSRSEHRLYNRLYLEQHYPEITKLAVGAGPLHETGVLPPMPVPFTLTRSVLLAALFAVLFSPIWVLVREIAGHKRSVERAGSDSSVKSRDWFERAFGFALLLILAFALFEALPVLVDKFHQFRVSPEMNWNAIFASLAGVSVAVLGGASKLLSVLGGAKKKLAMLIIGLLGVLVPLLVILYVTEFQVYPIPDNEVERGLFAVMVLPIVFAFLILLAIGVGYRNKSFGGFEYARLFGLLASVLVGMLAMWLLLNSYLIRDQQNELKFWFVLFAAVELWLFCRLILDVNQTSIHGLYRDRLASAYLVGLDTAGDVGIEEDINLSEIGCYEARSTAPYHLVNATLNLQGSKDASIRDRNSDFFVFSKRFIGGPRTGYCRSETLEQVHPEMNLATAMAISAAAASPNMGRGTNPAMVAFMVLLNIRLGYWLPNPGILEENLAGSSIRHIRKRRAKTKLVPGLGFKDVFEQELLEIEKRWNNVYPDASERQQRRLQVTNGNPIAMPSTEHGLVGLGFSGGGIRSATINLGIAQALHERGVFDHVDYMSTVSGGGYLGSSISTLMRRKTNSIGHEAGPPNSRTDSCRQRSEIDGVVSVARNELGDKIVKVTSGTAAAESREYRFSRFDPLAVENGDKVKGGQSLVERHDSLWDRLRWRVPPSALIREMTMKLDESRKWVNLSDGGHIENLAGIELLRRRCKLIIIGDGEADPELSFNGLATLIRFARIDLGITIDIHPDSIRVDKSQEAIDKGMDNLSCEHWAFGTITYPPTKDNGQMQEEGYLLYLKSSYTGDEDEVIKEYRRRNPAFPHESTADQFFDENQFECYRALGQHIGEMALQELSILETGTSPRMTYDVFEAGLSTRARVNSALAEAALLDEVGKKWDTWLAAVQKVGESAPELPGNANEVPRK